MLHKSHMNIFFIRLRWFDFQQLKREADVDQEWTITATNQSNWSRKCTFFLFDLPKANTAQRGKASLAQVQLRALSSHDCRDSTGPVPHSPAWWHLWLWWDDTPASRPRNSRHTSPAAHRKGCRCAPPPSGTPAPPPPASRWSCRSCDSTLLQTSTLRIREYNFGIGLNSILSNLVKATLAHVRRSLRPAAIRHGVSCYH